MRAYARVCKFKRAHASGCLYDNDNDNVNGIDNVNDNGQRCCAKKRKEKNKNLLTSPENPNRIKIQTQGNTLTFALCRLGGVLFAIQGQRQRVQWQKYLKLLRKPIDFSVSECYNLNSLNL